MIAALDVQYDDSKALGTAAAVLFRRWDDELPVAQYTVVVNNVEPYVAGQFYRRELPCLLAVIKVINEPLDRVIVDSYVRLREGPGLGEHLFEHLSRKIPVIGVANPCFHGAHAVSIFRGASKTPLYVTAIGTDQDEAANHVMGMHGPHRIPALLKRVDKLARGIVVH